MVVLNAADIGEQAMYNWYDQDGNLVYVGKNFQLSATDERKYKLEVIALSDGYKDYDEAWIRIVPGKIESIVPNPASDMVTVTCVYNNVSNARIKITNVGGIIYDEFSLNDSHQSVNFDISHYQIGSYVVTLFCDGMVTDSKIFVKQ